MHKSDVGGVLLNIHSEEELMRGYRQMEADLKEHKMENNIEGILVQHMLTGGKETILGVTNDPQFGPLIMFGLGGIYVEVLKDVSFRVHPLTDLDAKEMIESIQGYKLLTGVRGEEPVDIEQIQENLMRLSQLVSDFPEIEQVDINPLLAFKIGDDCQVLDAKMVLKSGR